MVKLIQELKEYSLKKLQSSLIISASFGVISGISVFYFLYFLEAYGIQQGFSYSGHSHLYRSVSFGLLTFIYLTILEAWLKPKHNITSYKQLVLWYGGLVVLGSHLIFLLFNFFWNWQEWNWGAYLLIMKEFPLIMIIPLSFYLLFQWVLVQRNNQVSFFSFHSENGKDQLKIKLDNFLFAKSSENYVTILYMAKSLQKKHLIRKPLKVLEQELKVYPEIQKTHRSYLVNTLNVQSIKQLKGKVSIEMGEHNIPISKKYQSLFIS